MHINIESSFVVCKLDMNDSSYAHPNSVEVAKARRKRAIVAQGKLDIWRTTPQDLLFMGMSCLFFSILFLNGRRHNFV